MTRSGTGRGFLLGSLLTTLAIEPGRAATTSPAFADCSVLKLVLADQLTFHIEALSTAQQLQGLIAPDVSMQSDTVLDKAETIVTALGEEVRQRRADMRMAIGALQRLCG